LTAKQPSCDALATRLRFFLMSGTQIADVPSSAGQKLGGGDYGLDRDRANVDAGER